MIQNLCKDIGGKGAGLVWLENKTKDTNLKVPPFIVIPTGLCLVYPYDKEKYSGYCADTWKELFRIKYGIIEVKSLAVRSGAEKSLPGLMDTMLWVKPEREEVKEAIEKVWESYYNLPDEFRNSVRGTAVVLQQMVEEGKKTRAGVIFPTIEDDKISFIFRYTTNVGEDIVCGKKVKEKTTKLRYASLRKLALEWAKENGTLPEMEIVQVHPFQRNTYIVQIRDYKTLPEEALVIRKFLLDKGIFPKETLTKIKIYTPTSEAIVSGEGCGSAVGKISSKPADIDYIYICNSGISLKLTEVVKDEKCKGLIFCEGSLHCHGVVLFRGYKKAYARIPKKDIIEAFSSLPKHKLEEPFLLKDGSIYSSWEEKTEAAEMENISSINLHTLTNINVENEYNSLLRWIVSPNKTTSSEIKPILTDNHKALVAFIGYKLYILLQDIKLLPYVELFYMYLTCWSLLGCLGELRYARTKTKSKDEYECIMHYLKHNAPSFTHQKTITVLKEILKDCSNSLRESVWTLAVKKISNINLPEKAKEISKLMHIVSHFFSKYDWHGCYGGEKWGTIALFCSDCLKAFANKTIEIDKLIALLNWGEALEHNNRIFFDKFVNVTPFIKIMNSFNDDSVSFGNKYYNKLIKDEKLVYPTSYVTLL